MSLLKRLTEFVDRLFHAIVGRPFEPEMPDTEDQVRTDRYLRHHPARG